MKMLKKGKDKDQIKREALKKEKEEWIGTEITCQKCGSVICLDGENDVKKIPAIRGGGGTVLSESVPSHYQTQCINSFLPRSSATSVPTQNDISYSVW
jgi:5-methylcytosine-specific restriction endonuclease McrA